MNTIFEITTTIKDGNIAYHVGDDPINVDRNRENLSLKYQFELKNLRYMNQVHGGNVVVVDEASPFLIDDCDALITAQKNIPLMVMVADCIPIVLSDETKGVIAVIHAGRNSTFLRIAQKTVERMVDVLGVDPKDIKATLGPSIQKCCYEVSQELADIVKTSFGEQFVNTRLIDLQGINKSQLEALGVKDISISNVCTKCSNQPYFSYRNDKKCGRFCMIAMVE